MRVGELFAGIGGMGLGLERAGHDVAWQVERDPFCQRVLARRWPGVERGIDVRGVRCALLDPVDLLVGGFPCQDLSLAGKRAGLGGERSSLFWEIVRIAKEARPPWGLFENVPGLISSHGGRDLWLVLQGLRECWPAVGWRVLDSQHFGVAQRRRRLFLVGGPDEDRVASVLALFEGGGGPPASGDEAGPDVARCLATGTNGSRYDGESENFIVSAPDVAAPLIARSKSVGDQTNSTGFGCDENMAVVGSTVRRLTPVEYERLQGFPDGWTCLCTSLETYAVDPDAAALTCTCPDGSRYRALGNAVTVNVITYLGHRLNEAMQMR